MRHVWFSRFCIAWSLVLGVGTAALSAAPAAEKALSANEVIQKAVSRAQRAQSEAGKPGYTYTKATVTEELDSSGNVKDRKEKVYQVSFQGGATRVKLIGVNGHAPREADLKKQDENDANARQMLGSAKSGKGDNRENFLTPELVARFDFKVLGQSPINNRPAYQVTFQPKVPEPPVHGVVDRFLNRISGTLWIDVEEFEIARADIQLRSEVNLLGGVIGSLKKLAYTMTRTRVGDGLWFNNFSSGDFEGRKLIDSMRIKTKSQCTNFRMLGLAS
jgi:hypothetical protein